VFGAYVLGLIDPDAGAEHIRVDPGGDELYALGNFRVRDAVAIDGRLPHAEDAVGLAQQAALEEFVHARGMSPEDVGVLVPHDGHVLVHQQVLGAWVGAEQQQRLDAVEVEDVEAVRRAVCATRRAAPRDNAPSTGRVVGCRRHPSPPAAGTGRHALLAAQLDHPARRARGSGPTWRPAAGSRGLAGRTSGFP
jgi:hypothetical protein